MSAIVRLYRGENDYNFRNAWKWGIRISALLVLVSVVSLAVRGLNLGIDFEGGVSWEVKAPGLTVDATREALGPAGLSESKIQVVGADTVRVQATAESQESQDQVRQLLADLAGTGVDDVGVSNVGPTWGGEITQSAIRALIVFLIAILGYVTLTFRGEWKLAIGVVVAVVHDVIISLGVYSVFYFEVTPATVIAFLTILGYSIYDTVVVYDKVQENAGRVGMGSRMTYTDMMNLSMNQVLLRSLSTSITSILPVISLLIVGALILGAVTLEEFAIALTVGMGVGVYSSIFVAAPVVVWLKEREPRNVALRERLSSTRSSDTVEAGRGTPVPAGAARIPASASATASTYAHSANHPPRPRKKTKK
jgi:preprotein translocase subunit SecF